MEHIRNTWNALNFRNTIKKENGLDGHETERIRCLRNAYGTLTERLRNTSGPAAMCSIPMEAGPQHEKKAPPGGCRLRAFMLHERRFTGIEKYPCCHIHYPVGGFIGNHFIRTGEVPFYLLLISAFPVPSPDFIVLRLKVSLPIFYQFRILIPSPYRCSVYADFCGNLID